MHHRHTAYANGSTHSGATRKTQHKPKSLHGVPLHPHQIKRHKKFYPGTIPSKLRSIGGPRAVPRISSERFSFERSGARLVFGRGALVALLWLRPAPYPGAENTVSAYPSRSRCRLPVEYFHLLLVHGCPPTIHRVEKKQVFPGTSQAGERSEWHKNAMGLVKTRT